MPASPPALRGVQRGGTRRHPSPRSGRQLPIGHRSPSGNRSHFFEIQFNSLRCKVQLILSIVSFLSELSIWYTNLYIISIYILFTLPITFCNNAKFYWHFLHQFSSFLSFLTVSLVMRFLNSLRTLSYFHLDRDPEPDAELAVPRPGWATPPSSRG